ncbi:MAG: type II secretion system protein [Candidatus Aureabacteria bacterium]|nr:type II secretion system protein [Candidatus Auribacterota bacterium]
MKKTNGFTLIEVLIGVVVIALTLSFAYTSINFSSKIGADMEEQFKIDTILEAASEYVHSIRYDFVDIDTGMTIGDAAIPGLSGYFTDFRNLSISVEAKAYDAAATMALTNLKQVNIVCTWIPIGKRNFKSESVTTLVSKPK